MTQNLTLYLKTETEDTAQESQWTIFFFHTASSNHNYRPSCVSLKKKKKERESQIPGLEGDDVSFCYGY